MTEKDYKVELEFIAVGGNRHPSAADWAPGLLAFGAGNNIALWDPEDERQNGISCLLAGHTDIVNAVKICDVPNGRRYILSGGADKAIRIWSCNDAKPPSFEETCCINSHQGSINTISSLAEEDKALFVTGAADSTVKVWSLCEPGTHLQQSICLHPPFLPLTTATSVLSDRTVVLAVAGTSCLIQLYSRSADSGMFVLRATLSGHESWIRSLDFVVDKQDLLLASASQDKYIRLWRLQMDTEKSMHDQNRSADPTIFGIKRSLSNKAHLFNTESAKYSVTFEALLVGHEDWVYTTRWAPSQSREASPTLLSASADNSLAIWQVDIPSSVWVCNARIGEISAQKGSTTATGSIGGYWMGLWQPDAKSVVSLGRTGSWRKWCYDPNNSLWNQAIGISGHVREVRSLTWAPDGSYLLTTSSDQTTRMFAQWNREYHSSWHEFSRPQIHGYDLNCIESLEANCFLSGADEKLLRVFTKPNMVDKLLVNLSGVPSTVHDGLADTADMPVLGLSNKAIVSATDAGFPHGAVSDDTKNFHSSDLSVAPPTNFANAVHPPFEDDLARHTLWPELEKLYGHGYEISAVAASNDGSLVATACKASSIDHAVIRLYETKYWREVKPSLAAHSLTVTSLAFSKDDRFLLSVGRDRQLAVFEKNNENVKQYHMLTSNSKAHTRMILDCSWAPLSTGHVFATAGRDKNVKIWRLDGNIIDCLANISVGSAITAVAFNLRTSVDGSILMAFGTEDGGIKMSKIKNNNFKLIATKQIPRVFCPSAGVSSLRWRTVAVQDQLAVASEDSSLRILNLTC
ncbi:hypothetical protein M433DRAFT_67904 [Acidomyces richmondensis BFW]|nr:MAG: hypothetical protein FE78DRAFT_149411 [Acidomyces sp. 'richmondensis']KYG45170.1 hypothetical protein M433DRAFT_67904 [Acidomyces richmondensis BFW]